ncbi:MAG TPA: DUF5615 family PIN-like protein [Flavipsychrobacter sp.]|nr:DUF5615 family PIN-like protein [Flavipsychrobacter sp.]
MSYTTEEVFLKIEESLLPYIAGPTDIRFLVDAQLPKILSDLLLANGFDSKHTLDLPAKNATSDSLLKEIASNESRIVVTKDDDFLQSYILYKKPARLILVKTGNITNNELLSIFINGLKTIALLISRHSLVVITKDEIITG